MQEGMVKKGEKPGGLRPAFLRRFLTVFPRKAERDPDHIQKSCRDNADEEPNCYGTVNLTEPADGRLKDRRRTSEKHLKK